MDEAVDIVRGLSAGGYFECHGECYDLPSVMMSPVPTEPLPILVGGPATPALRRAAWCDGWLHGGGDPADLPGLLLKLRQLRQEEGTADKPFEVHVISLEAFSVDGIHRLEEEGVTDVIVGFRWPYAVGPGREPLQTKLDNLKRFADDVSAKVDG
jgi:alkanesulfonate monooxygenase SsuD/methylene tetrahydromethanopterin reductase-like flavin-dependent oxidoreductase (luciferase family)